MSSSPYLPQLHLQRLPCKPGSGWTCILGRGTDSNSTIVTERAAGRTPLLCACVLSRLLCGHSCPSQAPHYTRMGTATSDLGPLRFKSNSRENSSWKTKRKITERERSMGAHGCGIRWDEMCLLTVLRSEHKLALGTSLFPDRSDSWREAGVGGARGGWLLR